MEWSAFGVLSTIISCNLPLSLKSVDSVYPAHPNIWLKKLGNPVKILRRTSDTDKEQWAENAERNMERQGGSIIYQGADKG